MTIDSSGNVGIGYTTPSNFSGGTTRLVAGGGSGNEGITIFSGNTGTGSIAFADGTTMTQRYEGLVTYNHNTNYMGLWTNHVERMKIDSSGAVNIVGALTAASYADNTPFFSGDAITEIMKVKGKDGELDHKTLPTFARITKTEKVKDKDGKIEKDVDGKDKVKITEHRDLGAMISILTKGMQEQQTLITAQAQTINNQDDRIKALESV